MIIESILNALKSVIFAVFSWLDLPNMADYGDGFENGIAFIDTMFESAQSLINLFLPWDIVRFGFPIIIVVLNFDHIYDFIMWILKKIPMLNIK